MELMRNRIRPYAWGSRTAIAELTGERPALTEYRRISRHLTS